MVLVDDWVLRPVESSDALGLSSVNFSNEQNIKVPINLHDLVAKKASKRLVT